MLDLIFQRVPLEEFEVGGIPLIHRVKLRKSHTLLVNNMDSVPVTDYLFQEGILTSEDKNTIKLLGNTPEERNRILLEKLPRKGPNAFVKLRESLRENEAQWIVDELDEVYVELTDLDLTVVPVKKSASPPITVTATPSVTMTTTAYDVVTHPWSPAATTLAVNVSPAATTLAVNVSPAATTLAVNVSPAATTLAVNVSPAATTLAVNVSPAATTLAVNASPVESSRPQSSSRDSHPLISPVQPLEEHTVGIINFNRGVVKQFKCMAKSWESMDISLHQDLLQKNLDWNCRVCAEGDGKVYVLNTRDMVLHCLDVASRQWDEIRQVDVSYRAQRPAMTYSNGRLFVSGGESLGDQVTLSTMVSIIVADAAKSNVPVQQEPDMLYRRFGHMMSGLSGRVLVCGGFGDTGRLAHSEVFDLGTGSWSRLSDMPIGSRGFGLILSGTAVFVLGGVTEYIGVSPTLSDTVSVFDWQTLQWTPLPRLPMPLCNVQSAIRGGSLWLLAAVTGSRKNEDNPDYAFSERIKCVLEYNVLQQTWVTHHNTPDVGVPGVAAYTFPL